MDILTLGIDASMATLAWLVQGILYPAFRQIPEDRFQAYHAWYSRRITWYVGPLMVLQVILHAYHVVALQTDPMRVAAAVGVLATWIITGLMAVPLHGRLGHQGYDAASVDRLIRANLLRTLIWTGIPLAWIPYFAA